ncbi:hypothetical protein [Halosolutus halophilus]|uniref:hypothetical protein n=1 Tax=Halosolutus halophilus TaxID=1552990 RepID=UPI002235147A|nr:hypothetical protein [Halosolutus halophilus]
MMPAEERLSDHLVEDESVQRLTSGRFLENPTRERLAVGLTDRRLLCVSNGGSFTDIRYDYVSSIESRQRTRLRFSSGPEGQRVLGLVGGILAIGVLLVGFGRLSTGGVVRDAVTVGLAIATVAITTAIVHAGRRDGQDTSREQLFVGTGVVSVLVLVSVGLFSSTLVAPLFVVTTLGGLALVWYGQRHRDRFDEIGLDRQRETHLSITTVDGRTIDIAVEADTDVDRMLSAAVYRDASPAAVHLDADSQSG